MKTNQQSLEREVPSWRVPASLTWFVVLLVLCVLVVAELLWAEKIVDWLGGGRLARQRASIITSYYEKSELGYLPPPANTNAFEILYVDKGPPYRMAVSVRTQAGETRRFQLVRPGGESGTNWGFRPESNNQVGEKQTRDIIASYYRKAATGLVPVPGNTNAIRIFPSALSVTTASGETNWFTLVRPLRSSGTNWGFNPR